MFRDEVNEKEEEERAEREYPVRSKDKKQGRGKRQMIDG